MSRVSNENLEILIEGLEEYKKAGVKDDWVLSDGVTVEPLSVLQELKELRDARFQYDDHVEIILAEVIDELYIRYKPKFAGKPHHLGSFKEGIKAFFHQRLVGNQSKQ